jgi:hypothetical protein
MPRYPNVIWRSRNTRQGHNVIAVKDAGVNQSSAAQAPVARPARGRQTTDSCGKITSNVAQKRIPGRSREKRKG